ncbi:hypothetical protein LSI54_10380 [Nesterenkonia sp. AY15]|uniref:hypothetical protein n=1 Tax=Nesterenkonia sp. AY15 TaxID=2901139 RepID=UPI001F4D342E|nr:hypothetical protein [Nesterenkonia sp. AY15]
MDESLHGAMVINDPEGSESRVHQSSRRFCKVVEDLVEIKIPSHELTCLEQAQQSVLICQEVVASHHFGSAWCGHVGSIEVAKI